MAKISLGEELLNTHFKENKLYPQREHKFHPTRRWRFDFAFPDLKLAVEVEGGTYSNGRHNRGNGYESDLEKYNEAILLGWNVLRFSTGMVNKGYAIDFVLKLLESKGDVCQQNG